MYIGALSLYNIKVAMYMFCACSQNGICKGVNVILHQLTWAVSLCKQVGVIQNLNILLHECTAKIVTWSIIMLLTKHGITVTNCMYTSCTSYSISYVCTIYVMPVLLSVAVIWFENYLHCTRLWKLVRYIIWQVVLDLRQDNIIVTKLHFYNK